MHLGPAAAAMERKGRVTERGQEHRVGKAQEQRRQLEAAQAIAEYINSGMEKARARLEAWKVEQAEKQRQAELEQARQREQAENKLQTDKDVQNERHRGGMKL